MSCTVMDCPFANNLSHGRTDALELCLALGWLANPAPAALDAIVEFHSFGATGGGAAASHGGDHSLGLRIGAADAFARLEVGSSNRHNHTQK